MFSIDLSNFWSQSGREYKRAIDQRGTKPSNRLRRRKGLFVNEDGKWLTSCPLRKRSRARNRTAFSLSWCSERICSVCSSVSLARTGGHCRRRVHTLPTNMACAARQLPQLALGVRAGRLPVPFPFSISSVPAYTVTLIDPAFPSDESNPATPPLLIYPLSPYRVIDSLIGLVIRRARDILYLFQHCRPWYRGSNVSISYYCSSDNGGRLFPGQTECIRNFSPKKRKKTAAKEENLR